MLLWDLWVNFSAGRERQRQDGSAVFGIRLFKSTVSGVARCKCLASNNFSHCALKYFWSRTTQQIVTYKIKSGGFSGCADMLFSLKAGWLFYDSYCQYYLRHISWRESSRNNNTCRLHTHTFRQSHHSSCFSNPVVLYNLIRDKMCGFALPIIKRACPREEQSVTNKYIWVYMHLSSFYFFILL